MYEHTLIFEHDIKILTMIYLLFIIEKDLDLCKYNKDAQLYDLDFMQVTCCPCKGNQQRHIVF